MSQSATLRSSRADASEPACSPRLKKKKKKKKSLKCAGALRHIKPLLLRWTDLWWGGVIIEMRPPERLERPECDRASGSGFGPVESSGEWIIDLLRPVLGQKCDLPSAFPACHEWTIRCGAPRAQGRIGPLEAPPGRGASSLSSGFLSPCCQTRVTCKRIVCRVETSSCVGGRKALDGGVRGGWGVTVGDTEPAHHRRVYWEW